MGNLEWVLIGEEDRSPKSEVIDGPLPLSGDQGVWVAWI